MFNPFGYAQSPFLGMIPTIPQRVVGLPIQAVGIPVPLAPTPIDVGGHRGLTPLGWAPSPTLAAHPAAYGQAVPFYGGYVPQPFQAMPPFQGLTAQPILGFPVLQSYGIQALPVQPQAFGIQGLPITQTFGTPQNLGLQGLPALPSYGIQGLPVQQHPAFAAQVPQGPQAIGQLPIQNGGWVNYPGLEQTGNFLGTGYECVPAASLGLGITATPRFVAM